MIHSQESLHALTDLMHDAEPDGQYSAAVTLINIFRSQPSELSSASRLPLLPAVLRLLLSDSWYPLKTQQSAAHGFFLASIKAASVLARTETRKTGCLQDCMESLLKSSDSLTYFMLQALICLLVRLIIIHLSFGILSSAWRYERCGRGRKVSTIWLL